MAIGTAVKKFPGLTTHNPTLPAQAIIQDRETFVDVTEGGELNLASGSAASSRKLQGGPLAIVGLIFAAIFYVLKVVAHLH
jgi:hypothetical protein